MGWGSGVRGREILIRRVDFVEAILCARRCAECFIFIKDLDMGTVIVCISQRRKPHLTELRH